MKTTRSLLKKKSLLPKKIKKKSFTVVAIGASAGGLEAVSVLLKNLPSNTGMAFIYVQHLSPDHKSFLTSLLAKTTEMKVQEINNMALMKPNNVYVIPPDKGIRVTNGHIKLIPRSKISSAITIDILFSSLAATHKENVIGIILSGYASDGKLGLKAIKNAGGITFAQDNSAQANSMPEAAIASGAVDYILSPKEIAKELVRLSSGRKPEKFAGLAGRKNAKSLEDHNSDLKPIFELLFKEKGADFSHYKMPTIKRRLNNKMLQSGVKTIKEYRNILLKKNNEIDLLYFFCLRFLKYYIY